jgi:CheY-like chemotaxis protein
MNLETSKKLHVLLADDDADDSLLFNEALQQSHLPIMFSLAEDGNKLLNYLEKEEVPDVLFLDVNMPYKNGIECLTEIRANEKFKKLPIVIYSTTNYKVNIEACFKAGANLYVVKPNSFEEIIKMVKRICSKEWTSTISQPSPEFFIMSSFE